MKRMGTMLLCVVLLVAALPVGAVTVSAATPTTSGTTGDCKWTLSGTKLTISGSGEMGDYDVANEQFAPWGTEITSVTINEGVTSVGVGAFYLCTALTEVSLPDSLVEIGDVAFCGCISLYRVTIPENVKTIGAGAFSICKLNAITIPYGVKTIGDMAFYATALMKITIPNSVTELGAMAFAKCYSLGSAIIGSGVTRLSEGLFYEADSFTSVTFTDSVTLIAEGAFDACPVLHDIYFTGSAEQKDAIVIQDYNYAITNNKTQWHNEIKPKILNQPSVVYAPKGGIASVTIGAIGYNLNYVWWIKNDGDSEYTKTSVTGDTYSVKMDNEAKNRRVICNVYDGNGNRLQSETVRLRESIYVATHPQDGYAKMGEKVSVKVEISGDGLRYEWWVKNAGSSKYVKSSITSSTYTTTMSAKSKNRRVLCKAYDQYGHVVQTESAELRERVSITTQPKTTYVQQGKVAKVPIKATGDGLTYQWYVKNPGSSKYVKSSNTTATYSVKMTEAVSGRRVLCYVYDAYGNKVQSSSALIRMSATIVTQPKTVTVKKNATAKTTVKAAGDGLTYTWYIKNAGAKSFSKSSVKSATYSVKMTSKVKNRQIYCVVKDKYGKTVKTSTVTLKMK